MKGVILCGGLGTRLGMFTRRVTNKHACLVYNRPMLEFPLSSLSQAGVKDVAIVTGNTHAGVFGHLVGNGREYGLDSVSYHVQMGEGGIADALNLVAGVVGDSNCIVILGDNVFEENLKPYVRDFEIGDSRGGASVILKPVSDPERFGVAEIANEKIVSIEEKPQSPRSNLAITGCYIFDTTVFSRIKTCKPSRRNELEITDVLKSYMADGLLKYSVTDKFWSDVGTPESLLSTAVWLRENELSLVRAGRWSSYSFKYKHGEKEESGDYLASSYSQRLAYTSDGGGSRDFEAAFAEA